MGLFQGRFASIVGRSVTAAAVSLVVLGAATSARASVIFDFVAIAALGGGNEGPFDNSASYATIGDITVQASASNNFGATSVAYLDDVAFTPSLPAGLGNCSAGLTGLFQCVDAADDNVTEGETLTLEFSDSTEAMNPIVVTLNPTFFRNANHEEGFFGKINIQIDNLGFNLFDLTNNFTTPLTGTAFDFRYYNDEFYISSITVTQVPLPAALPLFLSALAGLAFVGRRRGRQAAA